MRHRTALTPDLLLQAYRMGIFPMSESRDDPEVFWVDPKRRGILPLDGFHVSRSLGRTLRRNRFQLTADVDFHGVVAGCADRETTWINDTIFALYEALHFAGHAHSVEVWDGKALVGGVYGVAIGGAFFGESMFSTATDASKVALAGLIDRLHLRRYTLFDTQFITEHLRSLGGIEIPRDTYHARLAQALKIRTDFGAPGPLPATYEIWQRSTQTS